MAEYDQLEIISPNGEVEFHILDPQKGVTNIGRHPENDVVIDSPDVALFHAVLDHRVKPYRVIVMDANGETILDGQPLASNTVAELHTKTTFEISGYVLILLEGEDVAVPIHALPPTAVVPAPEHHPELLSEIPGGLAEQADEIIVTELPEHEWIIDVEQTATCEVLIINGGDIVAEFAVRVEGIDSTWVDIYPLQINLNEGERGTVMITITPPRLPTSRAGSHPVFVTVTSPNYAGRVSRIRATLTINPYYEFTVGELSPRQQTISWRKEFGQTELTVVNNGNSKTTFRLEGEDAEKKCNFEFLIGAKGEEVALARQADVLIPPGDFSRIPVRIEPISRPLVGVRGHTHSLTVTTTMLAGQQSPRALMGQLTCNPLLGPLHIALIAVMLIASCIFSAIPRIFTFEVNKEVVQAGEEAILSWFVSPFVTNLRIEGMEEAIQGPLGEKVVHPVGNAITYKLIASNLLAPLFGTPEEETTIIVIPESPSISKFEADKSDIFKGETVALSWTAENANELIFSAGNSVQAIPTEEYNSERVLAPQENTIYVLGAQNTSGVDLRSMMVRVHPADAVFSVQPAEIVAGESVTVTWSISVFEAVSIAPIGTELPPIGVVNHEPDKTTTYILTAANEQTEIRKLQQVTVHPAPTATAVPQAPLIEFFTVTPNEIISGTKTVVQLAWSVTGELTNVAISSSNSIALPDLPAQDMRTMELAEPALLILTARNGALHTSQKVEIAEKVPDPEEMPVIEFFDITPGEVVSGTETEFQLAWSVSGKTTNIVISAPRKIDWEIGEEDIDDAKGVSNLNAQDFITIKLDRSTSLVLTAINDAQRVSEMGEIVDAATSGSGDSGTGSGAGESDDTSDGDDSTAGDDSDSDTPTATPSPTPTPCYGVTDVDFTLYTTSGTVGTGYIFVAVSSPPTATLPIIYTWQATEQQVATHSNDWLHDTMVYTWTVAGLKDIIVSVGNACGSANNSRVIYIANAPPACVPLSDIDLSGPAVGALGASHTFNAAAAPSSASLPITYIWQATEQSVINHTLNGLNDAAIFTWSNSGSKDIIVTAQNNCSSVNDDRNIYIEPAPPICDALSSVGLSGPTSGAVGTSYTFNVAVSPATASLPLTYVWQASGQPPVTHTINSYNDTATFVWAAAGTQNVVVTVNNACSSASDVHNIVISAVCNAVGTVNLTGPAMGRDNASYTFGAAVTPPTTTFPITYTWQATGQSPVTHTVNNLNDAVNFVWSNSGSQAVNVTARNACGAANDTHFISICYGLNSITLNGAPTGTVATDHTFTATIAPSTATMPITYTWRATDQTPVIHVINGTNDAVVFNWLNAGSKVITVTAVNECTIVTDSYAITIE